MNLDGIDFEKRNKLCEVLLCLEKKGLEIRSGNLMTERVTYCRGQDIQKIYIENKEEINSKIKEIIGIDIGKSGENSINRFYNLYF